MPQNAPPTPELDQEFTSKYQVRSVLGEGGMGVVVAAIDTQLEREVAIKFIRSEMLGSDEVSARFLAEARAAAKIKSEHVVRVLEVGRLKAGDPYIVMERLEGQDLAQYLAEAGPLPEDLAIDYLIQACEAVAEAHWHNIVHRDLKPENLFFARASDGTVRVKVLDFGISKNGAANATRLTAANAIMGSPVYMSPEQMNAEEGVGARADVYALGAILFEMLTATPIFDGKTLASLCYQVVNVVPPRVSTLVPGVSVEVVDVVERCLAKSADDRPSSVGELARSLAPFGTASVSGSAMRVERIERGGRFTTPLSMRDAVSYRDSTPATLSPAELSALRRPKRLAWGVLVATVLAGAGGAVWLLGKQSSTLQGAAASSAEHGAHPPFPLSSGQAGNMAPLAPTSNTAGSPHVSPAQLQGQAPGNDAPQAGVPGQLKPRAREPRARLRQSARPGAVEQEAHTPPAASNQPQPNGAKTKPALDPFDRGEFGGRQ